MSGSGDTKIKKQQNKPKNKRQVLVLAALRGLVEATHTQTQDSRKGTAAEVTTVSENAEMAKERSMEMVLIKPAPTCQPPDPVNTFQTRPQKP